MSKTIKIKNHTKTIIFYVLTAVFVFFLPYKSSAQNGISLDVLKNDPYFSNGEIPERSENDILDTTNQSQDEEEDYKQTSNPDDSSTFYNAQNWPGKVIDADNEENAETGIKESETKITGNKENKTKDSAERSKKESSEIFIDDNGDVLETDYSIDSANENLTWKKRKIEFNAGYMPFLSIPVETKEISSYFGMDQVYKFDPYGVFFNAGFFFLDLNTIIIGTGLNTTLSYLKYETENYTLTSWQYTADLLMQAKWRMFYKGYMTLYLGGGLIVFDDLEIDFTNISASYIEKAPYTWIHPMAEAGCSFEYMIQPHLSADAGLDFAWPIMIDEPPYPMIQAKIGFGWHI